jgi:uncharacterized protein YciI
MPVNSASHSIHLPDEIAKQVDVQFVVHSRLIIPGAEQLDPHLKEHLSFMKSLTEKKVVSFSGPFFTREGKNTGDGMYVLRVDNIEEARRLTEEDPLHKSGVRVPTITPWLQAME